MIFYLTVKGKRFGMDWIGRLDRTMGEEELCFAR